MAVDLAGRLVQLEQRIAGEYSAALNPHADLGDLDQEWVSLEIAHCRADCTYFVDEYCRIESDTGEGVIPFKLWDYQADLLRQWLEHPECIVLKARQLGVTELAAALALWTVDFHPHNRVIVFSQDEPKAKEFARKCRIAWQHLPAFLQTPLSDPQKTTTLELANGSRILPQAATERAARSLNCQLLILDEFAHQEYGQAIFEASAVTARSAGNRVLVISTANGAGTPFHRLWLQAEAGEGMCPLFLPWNIRPGRDEEWYRQATKGYERWKAAQEFPSRPEEAFVLSGRCRFDLADLDAILAGCREPIAVEDLAGGTLCIWEMPQQNGRYVCGADVAEGLAKGDYSAAVVVDWNTGLDVAALVGHWPGDVFARHLNALCRHYHDAYLGVERNNHGHAVLLALATVHDYPALYQHTDYDAVGNPTPRVGWPTTSKTKPIMIDGLAQTFRERRPWRNAALIGEARTYVVKDNGDTAASGSLHDDRVVAYAIAEMLRKFEPPHSEVVYLADQLSDLMSEHEWEQLSAAFGGGIDNRY